MISRKPVLELYVGHWNVATYRLLWWTCDLESRLHYWPLD